MKSFVTWFVKHKVVPSFSKTVRIVNSKGSSSLILWVRFSNISIIESLSRRESHTQVINSYNCDTNHQFSITMSNFDMCSGRKIVLGQ